MSAGGPGPGLLVLGGGPAGLAVAWYATRAGQSFRLLERGEVLGGLCRTLVHGEHRYDTGAHRFHDRDGQSTRDLQALLGDELVPVEAPSQVRDGARRFDFPPTPLSVVRGAGLREAGRIGVDLVRSRMRRGEPVSFRDFAVAGFGETLARRILLSYTEKVWGLPSEELSPAVATRRLRGMSLRTLFLEFVQPSRATDHLDGRFLYPRGGYGRIAEAMAAELPGGAVETGVEVTGLVADGRRVVGVRVRRRSGGGGIDVALAAAGAGDAAGAGAETAGPEERIAVPGRVAATLPLPFLVRALAADLPPAIVRLAAGLRFRSVRLVFLRLARPAVSGFASIYLPDPQLRVSRVVEPRNRSVAMAPPGETSLVAEVPCFPEDEVGCWDGPRLVARVIEELVSVGLIEARDVVGSAHHHLPNAYPVYRLGWEDDVARLLEALSRFENLELVGRNGRFLYSHLHDQMRLGRELVARLGAAPAAAGV